jgi:transcriptional regulator with XRE-family HTH domain
MKPATMIAGMKSEPTNRIRCYREAKGWTQPELAEAAGVSVSMVSMLETGKSRGSADTLRAVAVALGITLDDMLLPPQNVDVQVKFSVANPPVGATIRPNGRVVSGAIHEEVMAMTEGDSLQPGRKGTSTWVRMDSSFPGHPAGELLRIDWGVEPTINSLVVAIKGETTALKVLRSGPGGRLLLEPLSPLDESRDVTPEYAARWQIVGVIGASFRDQLAGAY